MRGFRVLVFSVALPLALAGGAVGGRAETVADFDPVALGYVQALQHEGYSDITVDTTWLGRVRILAWMNGRWREIVLHPTSGEVLRDVVEMPDIEMADGDHDVPTRTGTAAANRSASGSGGGLVAAAIEGTDAEAASGTEGADAATEPAGGGTGGDAAIVEPDAP